MTHYEEFQNRLDKMDENVVQHFVEKYAVQKIGNIARPNPPSNGMNEQLKLQNESYMNSSLSKKEIQQQINADLLAQVPNYSGSRSHRFDDWILNLDSPFFTLEWPDEDKIVFLYSKLRGTARYFFESFTERYPVSAKNYENVKKALHDRFHSNKSTNWYFQEWEDAIRNQGEPIFDYADRLEQLLNNAMPVRNELVNDGVKEQRDMLLKHKFIKGLPSPLKLQIQYRDFATFEELVKLTNEYANISDHKKSQNIQFVDAIFDKDNYRSRLNSVEQSIVNLTQQLEKISIPSVSTAPPANFGPPQPFSRFHEPPRNKNRENNYQRTNNTKFNTPRKICNFCGKMGHESSTCWLKNRFCENCNKPGHDTEECKWRQQTFASFVPTCETCNQKGHPTKDCNRSNPMPRSTQQ